MDVYKKLPHISDVCYDQYLLFSKNKPIDSVLNKLKIGGRTFSRKYSRPLMIICETANMCTNDCIICAYGKMTRKKTVMPMATFEKVLRDYSEMGGGYLSLTPKSGEVLLDNMIIDRLELVQKYQLIKGVSFTTNAVPTDRFSDRELESILNSLCKVQISIYGMNKEEYKLMASKDYYSKMVEGTKRIIALADEKKTKVVFGFRLLKKYTPEEIAGWIEENFGKKIPFGYTYTYMNWRGALDSKVSLPYEGVWREKPASEEQCLLPLFACVVYSNGDVSFCSCNDFDICDEFRLGNVGRESLSGMYNSEKTRKLWAKMPAPCRQCVSRRPLADLSKYQYMFENPLEFIGA
jgi:sulfatase maturation enzyme AslB (radical SAM superfamily)